MTFDWSAFSRNFSKGLLLLLNALCIMTVFCTFGLSVVDMKILRQYGEENAAGTFVGDVIIIVASILLGAVACFGIVGTIRENVKILYLYIGFLMILVLLELLLSIYVSVQRYGLEFRVTEWLRDNFFNNTIDDQHQKIWDELQSTYECCGLNGPDDYLATQRDISLSCCQRAYQARAPYAQHQLYKACVESKSYFSSGCEEEILSALRESAQCLLGAAVMTFWFEAGGMLLAMSVINNVKNSVQMYKHTVKY